MAEWLGSGLQNRVQRFESARNLPNSERVENIVFNPFAFNQIAYPGLMVEIGIRFLCEKFSQFLVTTFSKQCFYAAVTSL